MKRLGSLVLVSLEPILRQLTAEPALRYCDDVFKEESLVVASGLRQRGRQALCPQRAREHFVGDHLAVDEHAVAVEDDRLQIAHRAASATARR